MKIALGIGLGILLLAAGGWIWMTQGGLRIRCVDCLLHPGHRHGSVERNAPQSLKTLASAQADFRGNNRDGKGLQAFWRHDVAGLYAVIPVGGAPQEPIKLIDISLAAADDRPVSEISLYADRSPKAGYWFRALRKKGEPPIQSSSQFAFCAFPAGYGRTGKWTYILDEENCIYKADLGHGRGIEVFPDEEEIRKVWAKLD